MMELGLTTPALLFPAISLLLLAYTNRFLALANLVRQLHANYKNNDKTPMVLHQIKSLKQRIRIIKYMQGLGVYSFLCCVVTMYCLYNSWMGAANIVFGISLLSLLSSLFFSLLEIIISTKAIELQLSDIEEI